MEKFKIYEIAKDNKMTSNEILEIAKKLNIDVKSHLSSIDKTQKEEIDKEIKGSKKSMKKDSKQSKKVAKNETNKKETNSAKKTKEIAKDTKKGEEESPVIVRRAVVINDDKKDEKKAKKVDRREEFGKIERNTQKDYNIVYKEEENRPLSIKELFGLGKTKKEKPASKTIKTKTPKIDEKESSKKEVKSKIKTPKTTKDKAPAFKTVEGRERVSDKKERVSRKKKIQKEEKTPKTERRVKPSRQSFIPEPPVFEVDQDEKEYQREQLARQREKAKEETRKEPKRRAVRREETEDDFDMSKLDYFKGSTNLSEQFESGKVLDYYDVKSKGRRKKQNNKKPKKVSKPQAKLTKITIPETIVIKTLAQMMKVTVAEVLKKLMALGVMANINKSMDFETAYLLAQEFGIEAVKKKGRDIEKELFDDSEDKEEDLEERPPVVVVMGHVDHGKTSLLDAIREEDEDVADGEAGGITQHIGAYQVKVDDKPITFLDTPGHEAFTSMRARGAKVTDIAILVVAANDGIMPQTVEAINHAKAADVPIIVAINKIDLPGANPERVKQELMEYDLVAEEWGGDTICIPISAKEKTNIDKLLEMVLLQAEMLELKANPNRQAEGTVIESRLDKTKGPIATVLIEKGTLNIGDTIVVGTCIGRIRNMINDKAQEIKKAGPSTPVKVTGITTVPTAGDRLYEVKDEKAAKKLIEKRVAKERQERLQSTAPVTLNELFNQIEEDKLKQLNIILKTDVAGTFEALKKSLEELSNDEIFVNVIHSNVGGVTESDVNLAKVSNALIIAFNVRPDAVAKSEAEREKIEIKTYSVIYQAIDDVKKAMLGLLDPEYEEVVIGTAEVRQTFKISKLGTIAGCYVLNGKIVRGAGARVIRNNVVLTDSKIISLKREQDDVKEVKSGYECGMQIEGFDDIKEMDIIEVYEMRELERKLKPRTKKKATIKIEKEDN